MTADTSIREALERIARRFDWAEHPGSLEYQTRQEALAALAALSQERGREGVDALTIVALQSVKAEYEKRGFNTTAEHISRAISALSPHPTRHVAPDEGGQG
ncbi:hypothetical protein [Microvirga lotononidis]|uniref:Uncharacterized protein n=1 Tax=Microvirga lotononidis TaxID=864069 RepID=I4YP08_9HYPH|nr:hypothetical protein [Microvirga lotononidis]EIM25700.1 hypothetical protein MicloDRAFT_00064270 [Microvirga lotononidis]WQO25636.1 hypothetical protein U0023_13010 [Microvirga lotononidis]